MDVDAYHPEIYGQIVSSLSSGVIAVDAGGVIITANPAASRHLNLPGGELSSGISLNTLPDVAPPLMRLMEELQTGQHGVSRREVTIPSPDGDKVLGVSASLLQGPEAFNGAIFLFIDLTELRRLEKTAELNKQLAQIGELTAGVVHELRNPLSVIAGMAELLMRKSDDSDGVHRKAETILAEAGQMEQLVSQFLNFAKPFELKQALHSPMDVVERSVELAAPVAAHRGIELLVETRSGLPEILIDTPKMAQALSNILRNAVEISPQGATVRFGTQHVGDQIVFRIDDQGPGIHVGPEDDLFSAFFTKKEGGTGLGLSIVHRIVTAHEGTITYGNGERGGAWFEVHLPLNSPPIDT